MKAAFAPILLSLACGGSSSSTGERAPPRPTSVVAPVAPIAPGSAVAPTPHPDRPPGELVTAAVEAMNGPTYGRPPIDFRKGSVSRIKAPTAKRTATGYQVQFASHATITTPTVYDRAVIVSGGFKSQQLYALEATTGKPRWALELHDDGPSSPACEHGVCVINTESCTIFAIAAETGKLLWSYWLGDPLTSAPTIAGDRVFASYPAGTTADGKPRPPGASHALAAFQLKTGKILWQLWLDSDVMSAPVAVGDFVYVTTFAGTLIKLEQATGKVRYAMKANATSAPVVQLAADGVEQMYYTRREDVPATPVAAPGAAGSAVSPAPAAPVESVMRTDHNHPKTKWEGAKRKAGYIDKDVQASSAHASKTAAEDEANGFSGGAPEAAGGKLAAANVGVASVSAMQNFQGSRIVKLRDKSVNTMGDEVVATDSETGAIVWSWKLAGNLAREGGFLGTAPLAAGTSVLFGTLDGKVVRLDQKTGKPLATYPVGGQIRSQPVIDGGWIFVGTEDGRLVAIDTKDPTVTGWPTWGGNAQRTGIAR